MQNHIPTKAGESLLQYGLRSGLAILVLCGTSPMGHAQQMPPAPPRANPVDIPIDSNRNLERAMQAAAAGLRKGLVLVIFPEGARSLDLVPGPLEADATRSMLRVPWSSARKSSIAKVAVTASSDSGPARCTRSAPLQRSRSDRLRRPPAHASRNASAMHTLPSATSALTP